MSPPAEVRFELKTTSSLNTFRTIWKVKNFHLWQYSVGTYFQSNNFTTHFEETKKDWYLRMYPFGLSEDQQGFVSLFLYCTSQCTAGYRLAILDKTNFEQFQVSSVNINVPPGGCGPYKFVRREKLFEKNNTLVYKHVLTILCEITMSRGGNVDVVRPIDSRASGQLSRDLGKVLESSRLCDFKITAGEREFKVHRAILAARSPVFHGMFDHNYKESITGTVDVPDVEPDTMATLLNFIYTGECPNVENITEDLLQASNKYELNELKHICSDYLLSRITTGNAASLLALADFCEAKELKENVLRFIIYNFQAVNNSKRWKSLDPSLIREVEGLVRKVKEISETRVEDAK